MPVTPVEFSRNENYPRERCGNRVRLEDADGDLVNAANPIPVTSTDAEWELSLQSDEAINDSDKTITVPAGYQWQILHIYVEYTSDATVGNRQLEIQLRDAADDVIGNFRAGATQAASLARQYMFAPALADLTAFRDTDYLMSPINPTIFLPAGYDIRIFDNNAVAVNTDDMIVQMMVARRTT